GLTPRVNDPEPGAFTDLAQAGQYASRQVVAHHLDRWIRDAVGGAWVAFATVCNTGKSTTAERGTWPGSVSALQGQAWDTLSANKVPDRVRPHLTTAAVYQPQIPATRGATLFQDAHMAMTRGRKAYHR